MSDKISVIVPIYNVEQYLSRCVDSILNQTYKDLDVILVDDGSTDSCPQICDEYAKKDKRIKVLHKENGGLSDARNAGMKVAVGDYISFIDSDDWVNIHFLEILLQTMIMENSDVIQCDRIILSNDNGEYLKDTNNYNVESFLPEDALSLLISENKFRQVVWNKLYKREIATFKFKKGATNEDEFWTYKAFGNSKKITYINAPMYYYFQREGSIMGKGYSLERLDGIKALVERHQYIKNKFPSLSNKSSYSVYCACMYAYQMSVKNLVGDDRKRALKFLKSVCKNYKPNKSIISKLNTKQKMWINMSKISFPLTCRIRTFLGVGF